MAECLGCCVINWGKKGSPRQNLLNLLQLEFAYLYQTITTILATVPKQPVESWVSPELEQWLQISFYITYIQCNKIQYNAYFMKGLAFQQHACNLGELIVIEQWVNLNQMTLFADWKKWVLADDNRWPFIGLPDDTGFPTISSLNVDAFILRTLHNHQLKIPKGISTTLENRVNKWPTVCCLFWAI
jgi:hypothetical protein